MTACVGFVLLAIFLGLLLAVWFIGRKTSANVEPADYAALRHIVEARTQPGDRVMVLATSPSPGEPMLLKTGRRPGSRYLNCMPLVMLYADWRPADGRLLPLARGPGRGAAISRRPSGQRRNCGGRAW